MSTWAGSLVRLRALEPDDWRVLQRLSEEQEGHATGPRPPRATETFRRRTVNQDSPAEGDEFTLGIEVLAGGDLVGTISTADAKPWDGTFSGSIVLAAEHRRHGYAAEAIVLLLRYMFLERRYQKCNVEAFAYNDASLRLCRHLGFVEEGRRRRSHYARGRQHDVVLLGMTVEEFAGRWADSAERGTSVREAR